MMINKKSKLQPLDLSEENIQRVLNKKRKEYQEALEKEKVYLKAQFPELNDDQCEFIFIRYLGHIFGIYRERITHSFFWTEAEED